jgi:hypothetical protein
MNREQLIEFIAAIPDLTHHRFLDTDDEYSLKIHEPHEVAERVADALLGRSYQVRKRYQETL